MPVARGGMGQLWAAQLHGTRGFQKIVALKTLLPEVLDNPRSERMFLEEARLASKIQHPNVVETLDLGEDAGTLYLVMEWVHGESLSRLCAQAPPGRRLPLPVIVNIVGQACRGLHSAHELRDESGAFLGVVHRDVTPHNLLVTYAGATKLVDFGIAKATAQASSLTQDGEVKGKVAYMAPEQICGRALDRRADIFGLGVVLYLTTTGEHPFKGENAGETVRNLCAAQPPRRPSELVSDYPRALEEAVMTALAKAPDERWPTAHDLLSALTAALPEAFQDGFEARVAASMNEVFGSHGAERMAALRHRQQLAQEGRLPRQSGISFRPASRDKQGTGSVSRVSAGGPLMDERAACAPRISTDDVFAADEPAPGGDMIAKPRVSKPHIRDRGALLITGALGLCALALGVMLGYQPGPAETAHKRKTFGAAARAPGAAASIAREPAANGAPRAAEPSVAPAEPVASVLEAPFPSESGAAASKAQARDARKPRAQSGSASLADGGGGTSEVRTTGPANAAAQASERSSDGRGWKESAWNVDAFGGRN